MSGEDRQNPYPDAAESDAGSLDPQPAGSSLSDQRHAGLTGQLPASEHPADTATASRPTESPQGAGCLPAILAATVLMGIVFFIVFGFSAWLIFQKRGDLASRTLRATIIPQLEQTRLDPDEKQQVIRQLSDLADDLDAGLYENWQAGGIMQRLIDTPMMRWGDLVAVDGWAGKNLPEAQQADANKQISRFFRAVELEQAGGRDIHDVLLPVASPPNAMGFVGLRPDLDADSVADVVKRAKLVADRAQIPDQPYEPVSLARVVRRQIEIGGREGAK